MWLTALSAGLKLLGLADLAAKMLEKWQAKQAGRREQRATDVEAENAVLHAELEADTKVPRNQSDVEKALKDGSF